LHIPIGDTIVNNFSHLKEVSKTLNVFNIKEAQPLKEFVHKGIFSKHLTYMRYNNLFTIDEEIGDN
jgi:hypothetical protein